MTSASSKFLRIDLPRRPWDMARLYRHEGMFFRLSYNEWAC